MDIQSILKFSALILVLSSIKHASTYRGLALPRNILQGKITAQGCSDVCNIF
jgi:hypothetical protein